MALRSVQFVGSIATTGRNAMFIVMMTSACAAASSEQARGQCGTGAACLHDREQFGRNRGVGIQQQARLVEERPLPDTLDRGVDRRLRQQRPHALDAAEREPERTIILRGGVASDGGAKDHAGDVRAEVVEARAERELEPLRE
eukprot:2395285-Prymnesium_polylepis.1